MDRTLLLDTLLAACTVMLIIVWILYQCYRFTWLRQHGRSVTAIVTQASSAKSHRIGGHTFDTAKWTDPQIGRAYTFEGLSTSLPLREGALVTVWVNPHHPQQYLMNQ